MGLEIERKFLLANDDWRKEATGLVSISQYYLSTEPVVRVRLHGDKAFMTVKGKNDSRGLVRNEWEFEIPFKEGLQMSNLTDGKYIQKKRWYVPVDKHVYEIDEFIGDNEGLIVAEIELTHQRQYFTKPDWLGEEVTGQSKYYNSELIINPFKNW